MENKKDNEESLEEFDRRVLDPIFKKALQETPKRLKKVEKKGLKLGEGQANLTKTEREILHLISDEFLTVKKIAIRRGTSPQATYKTINNLKEKGVISNGLKMVEKSQPTFKPFNHGVRLHGQEFNIKLLFKNHRYKDILGRSNVLYVDGNTIRLYRNSLEVYSGQSFFGDDVQNVTAKSFKYWNRFFARLENDLKVILIKPRYQNIRLVNAHYAEVNNELAKDCNVRADKIKVYATDDGKLWFLIDNSFNLHEAETLHPETSKDDMGEVVKPFFNDLRDNSPPTLSQMMVLFKESAGINKETAAGLNAIVSLLKPPESNGGLEGKPEYIG